MEHSDLIPNCMTAQDMIMMLTATESVVRRFHPEKCNCPKKCGEILYTLDTVNRESGNFVKGGFIMVVVRFMSNKILVFQEEAAYTIVSLLSDLGGSLGLYLGLCVLQIIEIVTATFSKYSSFPKSRNTNDKNLFPTRTIIIVGGKQPSYISSESVLDGVPGFGQIIKQESWCSCILWCIVSFIAFGVSLYQCEKCISFFVSDPSAVKTYYVTKETLEFPLIVTCYGSTTAFYFPFVNKDILAKEYGDISRKNFENLVDKNQVNVIKLWNMSRIEVFKAIVWINDERDPDAEFTEIPTTCGICVVFKPRTTVLFKGMQTNIYGVIILPKESTPSLMRPAFISMYSNPEDLRIGKYQMYRDATRSNGDLVVYLRVTESLYRNTRHKPCSDAKTVADCITKCFHAKMIFNKTEPCRWPFMEQSEEIPICKMRLAGKQKYYVDKMSGLYAKDCHCPRKCREVSYIIEDITDVNSKYHEWKFVISSNKIQVLEEEPAYTFIKLLCDLGGAVGLFFGLGTLQMCEIFLSCFGKLTNLKQSKARTSQHARQLHQLPNLNKIKTFGRYNNSQTGLIECQDSSNNPKFTPRTIHPHRISQTDIYSVHPVRNLENKVGTVC